MDMSDDLLLDSQEDTIMPNTFATSPNTFSMQVIKKLNIKSHQNLQAETANSIINMNSSLCHCHKLITIVT